VRKNPLDIGWKLKAAAEFDKNVCIGKNPHGQSSMTGDCKSP
jgi:hypothetical protein